MATELTLYFWGVVCLLQKALAKHLQATLRKCTSSKQIFSIPSQSA